MNFKKPRLLYIALLALLGVGITFAGCKKDDDMEEPSTDTVASFQFEVSSTNWAEVAFSNFSQNATSYSWDFGDGNTSTEESPTHIYDAAGSYDVTLTATGSGGSDTQTKTISITDPDEARTFLAGTTGKTWYLNRVDIAAGIGPVAGDNAWWSFGGVTPLGDRPCILDDAYTFNPDGSFEKNTGGTIFVDADANGGWLAMPEGCFDDTNPANLTGPNGEDLSSFANSTGYTYDYNSAENKITISGDGAYIGLPNKTSAGDNFIPESTKTYSIFRLAEGTIADTLSVAIEADDNSFAWNFYLVSYHNPADLPDIPSAQPKADFSFSTNGFDASFTNSSNNATTYTWDFGDGGMSNDENPTHTYATDGIYTVTLTVMDGMGQSDMISKDVTISSAVFTAAALSNATGKVWKLDGEASYIVGPCAGCGDWWGGIDAQGVIDRACQMDDEFIFHDDGTFEIMTQGEVWAESYMGGTNACIDPTMLPAPFDVFGDGTHAFTATDTEITVNGLGAYIGWNKPYNGAELPNDGSGTPVSTITYTVHDYSNNGGIEKLTITIDYDGLGTSFWTMRLISQ